MLLAGPASAQTAPAPTQWSKPQPVSVNPPAGTPTIPPPLPGAGGPGSRVVVFTKPAGDVKPVQNAEPEKKPDDKKFDDKRPADPVPPEPVKPPVPPKDKPTPGGRERGNPFRLRTDEEMGADILAEVNRDRDRNAQLQRKDIDLVVTPAMAQTPPVKAGYPAALAKLEPGYVVHRRLFFEEKNAERYGWEIGAVQPLLSSAYFVKDVVLLPAHIASNFWERYDTSAGKCPPGSPVAYYLYPPQITLKGGLVEAGAIIGLAALIP